MYPMIQIEGRRLPAPFGPISAWRSLLRDAKMNIGMMGRAKIFFHTATIDRGQLCGDAFFKADRWWRVLSQGMTDPVQVVRRNQDPPIQKDVAIAKNIRAAHEGARRNALMWESVHRGCRF